MYWYNLGKSEQSFLRDICGSFLNFPLACGRLKRCKLFRLKGSVLVMILFKCLSLNAGSHRWQLTVGSWTHSLSLSSWKSAVARFTINRTAFKKRLIVHESSASSLKITSVLFWLQWTTKRVKNVMKWLKKCENMNIYRITNVKITKTSWAIT